MTKTLPNVISLTRIVITPIFLWLLVIPQTTPRLIAALLFIIAGLSDWLDGRLARLWKAKSRFGQFIDPLADKVFVLGTFFTLPLVVPEIPWYFVILVAIRDLGITALRSWAESNGQSIPTLYSAKVKTTIQFAFLRYVMTGLVLCEWPVARPFVEPLLHGLPMQVLMLITLVATLWTGFQYVILVIRNGLSALEA